MKKLFFIFLTILLIGGIFWWINGTAAKNAEDTTQQTFTIQKGEGLRAVSSDLVSQGFIKDAFVFLTLAKIHGFEGKIQAGDFRISASQTPLQILTTFTKGTLDEWVTIPEGLRATEIAQVLQKHIPTFASSWSIALQSHEGYLFPDTYLIPKDATIDQIITTLTNNFNTKYAQVTPAPGNKLTQQEIVTIASIVQREAITPHDMQYVASTLENRLSIGMPLGSDVTVEYALGYQPDTHTWWKKDLTVADLTIDSPYNTRKVAGLPPTPISNPGLVALQAAANPPASDYLYYISDSKGVLHFAKTLEEHNANIVKYGE